MNKIKMTLKHIDLVGVLIALTIIIWYFIILILNLTAQSTDVTTRTILELVDRALGVILPVLIAINFYGRHTKDKNSK